MPSFPRNQVQKKKLVRSKHKKQHHVFCCSINQEYFCSNNKLLILKIQTNKCLIFCIICCTDLLSRCTRLLINTWLQFFIRMNTEQTDGRDSFILLRKKIVSLADCCRHLLKILLNNDKETNRSLVYPT